jgi:hypothetical protein
MGKRSGFSKPIFTNTKTNYSTSKNDNIEQAKGGQILGSEKGGISYKSILAESFTSGLGSGVGFQMASRAIDSIFGPKTVNINSVTSGEKKEVVFNGSVCINELNDFITCVKDKGYYSCYNNFEQFDKCFSK